MEIVQIASALFSAGSLMKNAFRKWRSGKDRDEPRAAGDTNVDVTLDLGLECESPEAAIIAVGSELAMKASRAFFPSRTQRRNQAITGLSTEFAAYRIQTQHGLEEVPARQQSASQAIAEELVGVRGDLRYGAEQLTRGMATVRSDLGAVITEVDGMWNTVRGVLEVNYAVLQGTTVVYRSLQDLQGEVAELQSSMDEAREENAQYFTTVSTKLGELEAYVKSRDQQQDRSKLQRYLRKARMHLIDFRGSGGDDFGLLDKAKDSCLKILACQPHSDTLDAHFMAGSIAIATSYAKHVQQKPAPMAKESVFNADLVNVAERLETFWVNPSVADTPTGRRVVEYLLGVASSICMLPPEGLLLPQLDPKLAEAFGVLCCSQPSLLDKFPEVGGAAMRALLQAKPLDDLCRMSNLLGVNVSLCDNKADIIQALLDEGKPMGASLLHQGTQEASDLSSDDTTRNSEDEHGTNSDDNWIRSEESEIDSGNLDDDSIGSFMRRRTAY